MTDSTGREAVDSFFDGLGKLGYDPMLRGVHGSILFDIAGAGRWLVGIADGAVTVRRSELVQADCVAEVDVPDFVKLVAGELSVVTEYLQGRMKVRGNLGLGVVFRRLLPAPRRSAHATGISV